MAVFSLNRGHIGLDIGTSAVRAAEIRVSGRQAQVVRFGQVLLPRGAVTAGEVQDPELVADALRTLWKRAGFGSRRVRIGVANGRVVVRQLEFPAMSREDLEGAIRFQAQEYIPIPMADAVLDFEILDEFTGPEGNPVQRVMVVAADLGMVNPLIDAVQRAKLEPEVLELNAYPLLRALGEESLVSPEVEAIIDVGGGVTNVVIHQGGRIRFTRILPSLGGDDFTEAIADALGLEWDEAESLKHRASTRMGSQEDHEVDRSEEIGFPEETGSPEDAASDDDTDLFGAPADPFFDPEDPDQEPDPDDRDTWTPVPEEGEPIPPAAPEPEAQTDVDDASLERAVDVLDRVLQRFANDVRQSVDFYISQPGSVPLSGISLTGGGSLLGGLPEQLEAVLRVPVGRGRPFARVPVGKVKLDPDQVAMAEPFLAVAIGLGLGGLED